jgi:hypothetical protein
LPAKCLLSTPLPIDLITVPACEVCNNGSSVDDEKMRIFLTLSFVDNVPQKTESLMDKGIRGIKGNGKFQKELKELIETSQMGYISAASGIIIDKGYQISLSSEMSSQLEKYVIKLAKGLYYHHFKKFIGRDVEFKVLTYKEFPEQVCLELCSKQLGDGSQFRYFFHNEEPRSLWFFEFYKRYWVSVSTSVVTNCQI